MHDYDFAKFLKTIETLSFHEAYSEALRENKATEGFARLESRKPTRDQDRCAARYENQLGGLLFWFNSGIKPNGLSDADFILVKTLCSNLVDKGQLKRTALDAFEEVEKKMAEENSL